MYLGIINVCTKHLVNYKILNLNREPKIFTFHVYFHYDINRFSINLPEILG